MAKLWKTFRDYCKHSTLEGLHYIVDSRLHYSERIFWIFCILLSWAGSSFLIRKLFIDFSTNSVSMSIVSMRPGDTIKFPSVAVCETGFSKELYPELEESVYDLIDPSLSKDEKQNKYNYDVEDFLLRIVFLNLYNHGSFSSYCKNLMDCDDGCLKCPSNSYQIYVNRVRASCEKLFHECLWNEKPFNCCRHFQPVQTSIGTCYLINSLHIKDHSKYWLDMRSRARINEGNGHLQLTITKASELTIMNEEDVPNMLLRVNRFSIISEGYKGEILINVQDTLNDPSLHSMKANQRKCVFPDETHETYYEKYSYSVCVTDCIKRAQLKACNCTYHYLVVDENDKSPSCDYHGLICLEDNNLIFPTTLVLQPWNSNFFKCNCLPSCNEARIDVVGQSSFLRTDTPLRTVSIKLQSLPSHRYYRHAKRDNIDIFVSLGALLDLFLGASILSFVEIIYFIIFRSWRPNQGMKVVLRQRPIRALYMRRPFLL